MIEGTAPAGSPLSSPPDLAGWARPDFFIVGAPKCGTTALFSYLGGHPEVYASPQKEPRFFGRDLRPLDFPMEDEARVRGYLALFEGRTTEKRAGEATPWYLYSSTAAEEIRAFAPDARIIIMLRNPVEMMYAAYYTFQKRWAPTPAGIVDARTHRVMSFEEALGTQEERRQALDEQRQTRTLEVDFHPPFHTDIAQYTEQVQRYFDVFGRERVHVVLYDDLKRDVGRTYRQVLEFLDVDPGFAPDFSVVNANKHIRSHRLHGLLRTGDNFVPLRKVMRAMVPVAVRKKTVRWLIQINLVEKARPPMHPQTAAWLRGTFEADIHRLADLLDRDLPALWLAQNGA